MDDPDMGDWSYTYDALGNLLTQTDARGCTTALTYDLVNRPESKSYSGSCGASTAAVSYIYDQGTNGVGQRTRMDDGSGYTTWSYDSRGRVTEAYQSVTGGGNFRTQWSYNSADLPVWMRYPADNAGNPGETVNFTYNTQMLLDRVYGTDTYVDDTWYDAAGRVTLRELGNSYTLGQSYVYYPWTQQGGRLQNLESGIAADTDSLQDLSYSYDAVGNVLSIIDYKAGGIQTQAFGYDNLDRLTSAVASGGTGGTYSLQNYTYNPDTGNLASNAGVNYTYGDSAHKHAVTSTSNGNSYGYDQNGNQTTRTVGGLTYTLIYDGENRLVQIKKGNNIQATYTYDGDGNRVKAVVGSTTTTYIGNYLEWTGSTTTMKKYYYAGGQRVAMRQGSSTLYFLLTDHLGSTTFTATSGGGLYSELRYYPWGGTRYTYGTTPTSYRYTGQREDSYINLYWYGSRWYDQSLGRFIQPDTIVPESVQGVQAWDRFAYVNNAPTTGVDPTGHWRDYLGENIGYPVPPRMPICVLPASTATPTPYQVTPTTTPSLGIVISSPTPTPTSTPTATPMPLESAIPMCETNGLDYLNFAMDSTGLFLDSITLEGGRATNAIQTGYSITEIGVDLFSLDFSNDNDWYDYTSTVLDFFGIFIPIVPDLVSIYLNQVHSEQCIEDK